MYARMLPGHSSAGLDCWPGLLAKVWLDEPTAVTGGVLADTGRSTA